MRVNDLLNEVSVYRNNSVKVMMVQSAIDKLFPTNETSERPIIKNDSEGLYITLDKIQMLNYINNGMGSFILVDDKFVDDYKNIRKYYIHYNKTIEAPKKTPMNLKKEA
ncbi:MAG: hypothetical protein DRH57_03100 [Candidatus Cloacimonadota bacterium]|nr:MAG: hypothetical protein DRH57_03100 [Candidatus Cloacimonadota bacterium]